MSASQHFPHTDQGRSLPGYVYSVPRAHPSATAAGHASETSQVPSSVPHPPTWTHKPSHTIYEHDASKLHHGAWQPEKPEPERHSLVGAPPGYSVEPHAYQGAPNQYVYSPMYFAPGVPYSGAHYPEPYPPGRHMVQPHVYVAYPPLPHWYPGYPATSYTAPPHTHNPGSPESYRSRSSSVSHLTGSRGYYTPYTPAMHAPGQEYPYPAPPIASEPKTLSFPPTELFSRYPQIPPIGKASGLHETLNPSTEHRPSDPYVAEKGMAAEDIEANAIQKETEEAFRKLIPSVKSINMFNFGELLLQILKTYDVQEGLDSFYDLLFNPKYTEKKFVSGRRFSTFDISQPCEFQLKGPKLSFLVLAFLKLPEDTICHVRGETIDNLMRPAINFHEFLRTFLAMRILQVFVKKVDDKNEDRACISRDDVYNAYSILCQKLILNNPVSAEPSVLIKELVLCKSKVGKLCKLLYPDLPQRRFGKRGESKYHMVGVTWNDAVMDPDTKKLVKLGVTDVSSYLKSNSAKPSQKMQVMFPEATKVDFDLAWEEILQSAGLQIPSFNPSKQPLFSKNPKHSFVGPKICFPSYECAPRDWTRVVGTAPKHSPWAAQAIEKSVEVLKTHGIGMIQLVDAFHLGQLLEGPGNFLAVVSDVIGRFKQSRPLSDVLLHFFRVILLLPFPSVISMDSEVSSARKAELRGVLEKIISELESEAFLSSCADETAVRTVTRTLRSMNLLSKMALVSLKSEIFVGVVQVLNQNISKLKTATDSNPDAMGELQNAFVRSVVTSTKSFDFEFVPDENSVHALGEMTRTFTSKMDMLQASLDQMLEDFQRRPYEDASHNLACEIFSVLAQIVHRVGLRDPLMVKLPMRVLTFAMLQTLAEFQNLSAQEFGKADPQISTNCFKTWYVSCAMMHEYFAVLCEIIALSERLHD